MRSPASGPARRVSTSIRNLPVPKDNRSLSDVLVRGTMENPRAEPLRTALNKLTSEPTQAKD